MKEILVIDAKKKCGDCPLLQQWYDDEYEEWYEMCFFRYCKITNTESKLGICPLKPIPTKEEIYERIYQAYGLGNDETYQRIRQAVEDIYDEMIGEEE